MNLSLRGQKHKFCVHNSLRTVSLGLILEDMYTFQPQSLCSCTVDILFLSFLLTSYLFLEIKTLVFRIDFHGLLNTSLISIAWLPKICWCRKFFHSKTSEWRQNQLSGDETGNLLFLILFFQFYADLCKKNEKYNAEAFVFLPYIYD